MKSKRSVGAAAFAMITAAGMAQVMPVCCKYAFSWPASGNPDPLCQNGYGQVCEEPAGTAWLGDPLARKTDGWRNAQCYTYTIANGSSFAQGLCSGGPPPGGVLVGVLPSGMCCYYVRGESGPPPVPTDRGFLVWKCDKECTSIYH